MKYLALCLVLLLPLARAEDIPRVNCDNGKLTVHMPGVVYRITGIRCERVDGA